MNLFFCFVATLFFVHSCRFSWAEDFYDLLGVNRDADNRQIRKAFKKMALTLHPDKNKDDTEANEKFMKLNRAYEILKDEELRKRYDLQGEEAFNTDFSANKNKNYHSWNYYYENFGIYDDDPEIITLSRSDFDQSVSGTRDVWFINYYSPACSHCHHLAPVWREVARELEGVIRIGAVNCEEDWVLCRQESINSYPSLILYPQREKYHGSKDTRSLVEHVLKELSTHVLELRANNYEDYAAAADTPWLVSFCYDEALCASSESMEKLSAMLDGLLRVAILDCTVEKSLCKNFFQTESTIGFVRSLKEAKTEAIPSNDAQEIFKSVLGLLPDMISLDDDQFTAIYKTLTKGEGKPWLIEFVMKSESDLQLRKLPSLLPDVNVGRIDCASSELVCQTFYIRKHPTYILFKIGGSYEVHHGRHNPQDIAVFVQESRLSSVQTLGPSDFPSRVVDEGNTWFVDFYAPWCPPCMRLLPEWRKASRSVDSAINFGTVDCTIHKSLCQRYNVHSYPTSILYNRSVPHQYFGIPSASALVEFVQDILSPPVLSLTFKTFEYHVVNRAHNEIWLVDFFAPWCQPCQQLSVEWRQLAKMVINHPNVRVAQVDCTMEAALCEQQNVQSYPSIRLYPMNGVGSSRFHIFNGWSREAHSLRAWAFNFLPSKVKELNPSIFDSKIIKGEKPSVVDFFAPWCGHCQTFAPEFEVVAQNFQEEMFFGNVNCEMHKDLCIKHNIHAYPTVLFYPGKANPAKVKIPTGDVINSQKAATIIQILKEKLEHLKRKKEASTDVHDEL